MSRGAGLHHIHKRKIFHVKLQEYPHPNFWINALDKILMVVAILGPIMNIQQVLQIFVDRTAAGVSLIAFVCFALFDIPWIIYGIIHKEKPLIVAYTLWFLSNLAVVVGVIIYS